MSNDANKMKYVPDFSFLQSAKSINVVNGIWLTQYLTGFEI